MSNSANPLQPSLPCPDPPAGGHRKLGPLGEYVVLCAVAVAVVGAWIVLDVRMAVLSYLLVPDDVLSEWVGRDFSRFGLLDRIPVLFVAGWILLAALLIGRLALDPLRVRPSLSRGEWNTFSFAVGLNLLSLLTLGIGLAGGMSRWWFVILTAVVLCGTGLRWRSWRQATGVAYPAESTRWTRAALIVGAVFTAFLLLGAMVPPWYFDVREYHLQVPKEWYQQGFISFLPHNIYGNMPLGVEMHSLLGMIVMGGASAWWWGGLVGKTVIAAYAPLTAAASYFFARRFFDRRVASVAAMIVISTPWVAHVSMSGLIDAAAAFYCVTAVHAVILCAQAAGRSADSPSVARGVSIASRTALLAGLLAGAGVACKYPAVVFLVVPLFGWLALRNLPRIDWRAPCAFVLGVAISCGPWLVKNWVMTGNPTYPLLYEWFGGKSRTPEKDAQWRHAHTGAGQSFGDRYSWNQLRYGLALIGWNNDYGNPLLIPLALVGLTVKRQRRLLWGLAAFCAYVILAWWVLTHRLDRFLVPLLPVASVIAGAGAMRFTSRGWRRGIIAATAFAMVSCLCLDVSRYVSDNRFFVALKDLRYDLPHPPDEHYNQIHPAHRLLNSVVPPGYRALVVGEAQVFDIEVPMLYNTCFDDCWFERLMKGKSRDERYAALREHHISHVFVDWHELDRYRSPGNYGYSDYVTRDIVQRELCQEQKLLRVMPECDDPEECQVFEVVGWRDWD